VKPLTNEMGAQPLRKLAAAEVQSALAGLNALWTTPRIMEAFLELRDAVGSGSTPVYQVRVLRSATAATE
jgi:hypothetical protein